VTIERRCCGAQIEAIQIGYAARFPAEVPR
jgi:hypothetical protein